MKNKVIVKIGGKEYTVIGQDSDEYMQKIGLYVDKKMNEILDNNKKLSTAMAAVLTAINVADDYFKSSMTSKTLENELTKVQKDLKQISYEKEKLTAENERNNIEIQEYKIKIARLETRLGNR